ncbi:MAG: hypothetical protein ACMUHY_06215 [Thermoplasmatota archaeon]
MTGIGRIVISMKDGTRTIRTFDSSLMYRWKKYWFLPALLLSVMGAVSILVLYVSTMATSYLVLILLLPILIAFPMILAFKASFYHVIFPPRIIFTNRYIEVPNNEFDFKPLVRIGYERLMYMTLVTYDYWKDGIFTFVFNNTDVKASRVIGDLSEIDVNKVHRISIYYVSDNRWGSSSVEIREDFFRTRDEFLGFVGYIMEYPRSSRKPRRFEPTGELLEKVEPFKRLKGAGEIVRPGKENIYNDRFLNRIFSPNLTKIALLPFTIGGMLSFGGVLIRSKALILVGGAVMAAPFLIMMAFMIPGLIMAFGFCGPHNFHFSTTMGISDYGLFFYKRPGEGGRTMDFIVPWKLVELVKYSRVLRSFAVYQKVLLVDHGKGIGPWAGVPCFFFTNSDALVEMERQIARNGIKYEKH